MLILATCDDAALAGFLVIIKRALTVTQIFGPIICIVSLILVFIKGEFNPDDKKLMKGILNRVLALVITFFLPVIVNATLSLAGDDTNLGSCWNDASDTIKTNHNYIDKNKGKKKNVILDPDNYENGTSTNSSTPSGTVSGTGGNFTTDTTYGVYGTMVSSIDGKKHTIYNQGQIAGWGSDCNRAAAASIASAYASYEGEAVDVAKPSPAGIGYISDVTNNYFSHFGLTASVNSIQGSYDTIKNDIVSNLSRGNYVMFDLSQPNVYGASGQKWTSSRHWLAILDIKKVGNDYAIFVSDSGHGGSVADHGLGAGWYSLDEFSGKQIANFTVISRNS